MYQKGGISPKIQRRRFGLSKFLGEGGVLEGSYISSTLQEVGILPTLVYFYLRGLFGLRD